MSDTSNIGKIHVAPVPNDAIHIAIAQVSAGEELHPGEAVGWKDGKEGIAAVVDTPIGIVDPFLTVEKINKDSLFYLFLYPNTVTSLTHQWEHPSFNRSPERIAAAENWLIKNCGYYRDEEPGDPCYEGSNYQAFKESYIAGNMHYTSYGDDFSEDYNSNKDGNFRKLFWDNLEIVTGIPATKEQRQQEYFTCGC